LIEVPQPLTPFFPPPSDLDRPLVFRDRDLPPGVSRGARYASDVSRSKFGSPQRFPTHFFLGSSRATLRIFLLTHINSTLVFLNLFPLVGLSKLASIFTFWTSFLLPGTRFRPLPFNTPPLRSPPPLLPDLSFLFSFRLFPAVFFPRSARPCTSLNRKTIFHANTQS